MCIRDSRYVADVKHFLVALGFFLLTIQVSGYHHRIVEMCIRDRYYSVNYDKQTVAAMAAAYGTEADRKSTRLNSSHVKRSRMPSSA